MGADQLLSDGRNLAVVGLQWGDEGKGKIIDWLSSGVRHVARFQGGHNAGHTVVVDGKTLVLHLIPSGILREHCRCYIGQGVVLNPQALDEEIRILHEHGIGTRGRLFVSGGCSLVLPHHVALDEAREKSRSIGTTLRGIGPVHEDKAGRCATRLVDVINGDFEDNLTVSVERANCELEHLHGAEALSLKEISEWARSMVDKVRAYMSDVPFMLRNANQDGEAVLLEASQGALLDVEQGSYPYVTSASCVSSASAVGLGIDLKPKTIGIAKAYATRVGNGAFPTQINGATAKTLIKSGHEYGSTTSRERRVGWFDVPATHHALQVNGCDMIALTKLDVLSSVDSVRLCVGYENGGGKVSSWPPNNKALCRCEPLYEDMDSWDDIGDITDIKTLPTSCREYVRRLEDLCDARVSLVSVGPEREKTLVSESLAQVQ